MQNNFKHEIMLYTKNVVYNCQVDHGPVILTDMGSTEGMQNHTEVN